MTIDMNKLGVVLNPYQGKYKRVLCVCSGGVLRSPTAAWVLSNPPFNHNTRSAGAVDSYALIKVDESLLTWAQEIVCMTAEHEQLVRERLKELGLEDTSPPIKTLGIPDNFEYRNQTLVRLIEERYKASV